MPEHRTGSRDEWLAARRQLLEREKAHARAGDELVRARQQLPWVRVEKDYCFHTDEGTKTLAQLFGGHSQLLLYHFMFGVGLRVEHENEGCTGCSFVADHFDAIVPHLRGRDVALVCVSMAPLELLAQYKKRMGWRFPWASSLGSEFNYDFGVAFTDEQQRNGAEYNFARVEEVAAQREGMSAFALRDGAVHHTYSTYARGVETLMGTYKYLDIAPAGRNEAGLPFGAAWWRRHDEYGTA